MANPEHLEILKRGVEQWNQWRKEHPDAPDLHGASLAGAQLSAANLFRANLSGANLCFADLAGGNLTEARLSGASLGRTNLRRANLCGANLWGANLGPASYYELDSGGKVREGVSPTGPVLTEASLVEATLSGAKLVSADLSGANLTDAKVGLTVFADVDLSVAKGLESVKHQAPSYVSIDTMYRSRGKIPEVFLRGCGVPETFITFMHSLVVSPIEFYSCFISYSHEDKLFARRLHDTLQGRGIRCWLDEKQLLPGDHIRDQVDRGIRLWDKVLLCCSEHSLGSFWVDEEIGKAFEKEERLWKERKQRALALVPLNLDGYLLQWESGNGSRLRERLAADFTGWKRDAHKFEAQVENVIKALRSDEGARDKPPVAKL